MKRIILFAFILALSVSGYAFGASSEAIIYVVGEGNIPDSYEEYDDDGNVTNPAYAETLEDAMSNADTYAGEDSAFTDVNIIIQRNTELSDTISLSSLSNVAALTISGSRNTITLTAPDGYRHFNADNSSIEFVLSTITLAGNNGGGIIISEGSPVFSSVIFRANTATEDDDGYTNGGAILITGTANPTFTGCTFTSNTATDGGAIYAASTGTVNFTDTNTFSQNYTEAGNGGAIYIASGQTVNFAGTVNFTGNYTAEGNGGAIYVSGTGKITNDSATLTFDGNHTQYDTSEEYTDDISEIESGYGGAVCMAGSETIDLGTATFTNNYAVLGGAVFMASVSSEMDSSSFSGSFRAAFSMSRGTFTFHNPVKHNADKGVNGGAVFMSGGTLIYKDTVEFASNEARNHGGALYVTGSNAVLNFAEAPVFSKNIANSDNGNVGDGGAVYWNTDVSKFTSYFPASTEFNDNLTYGTSRTVSANAANGGAIYISQSGTLTLDGTTQYVFSGNTAYNNGGAIYTDTANVTVISADISEKNSAQNGNGGFICSDTGTVNIQYSTISNQEAQNGGAVHAVNVVIMSSDFTGNSSVIEGGAIYVTENGTLTIINSDFTKNTASGNGGAINTLNAAVTITETVFSGNTANGNGGALYTASQCDTAITNCTFEANQAINGGALRGNGAMKIDKSYFDGNYASSEGGSVYFNQVPGESSFIIKSSMLCGNIAGASSGKGGGALWLAVNDIEINSCTFDGNSITGGTTAYGGAVYLDTSASSSVNASIIENSTFTANTALNGTSENYGGAVYLLGKVNIRSCAFTQGNSAKDRGGALYIAGAKADISGTIIVGNSAPLGADVFSVADDSTYWTSSGYNRIGVYGLVDGNTSWLAHNPLHAEDREDSSWTTATFYSNNTLSENEYGSGIPPETGAARYASGYVKLKTLMLNEATSLAERDRATNAIQYLQRYNFPELDERGANRRIFKTAIDIGPVMFEGTVSGDPSQPITTYTVQSVTMSGIPNTLRSIGQTASLLAMIRYTNGRTAYGGDDEGYEPVIWSSSNQQAVRIDQNGNITALALTPNNSYVTISVTTKRNTADGTPATDSRPVRVTGQYSYLNISSVYQNYLAQYVTGLAEHDIAVSLADVNSSSVKSSSFQRAFKSAWTADKATQITDLTSSAPEFSTYTSYNASGYTPSKRAAANINFQNRNNGDVFPVIYSWTFSGSEIKSLFGYDLSGKTLNANLADELFNSLRIDFQGAGKNFQVVGGSGVSAKDAYTNQALTLTKADGGRGVKIELTAYLANVNATGTNSDGTQLMGSGSRKLLVVPDGTDDGAITGSMWMIQKGSSSSEPSAPEPSTPETPDDGKSGSKSGGSGGGGGCDAFSAGIALALIFMLRRKR